jgi:hypothetical protein
MPVAMTRCPASVLSPAHVPVLHCPRFSITPRQLHGQTMQSCSWCAVRTLAELAWAVDCGGECTLHMVGLTVLAV